MGVHQAHKDQNAADLVLLLGCTIASIAIIPGWPHLADGRNIHGLWLIGELDLNSVGINALIASWTIVLPCFVLGFRYYTAKYRRSLWVDVAFVSIVAGIDPGSMWNQANG